MNHARPDTAPREDGRMAYSPEDVRDALARCFLRHGADRPQWLADLAMPVVRAALEERDAEIARLAAVCGGVSGDAPVAGAAG